MLYYYVYLRAGGVPTRHTHEGGLHTRYLLESTHTNTHKHTQTQTNAQRGPTKYGAGSRDKDICIDSETGERDRGAYEYGFLGLGGRERGVRGEERERGDTESDEKTVGGRAEGWQPHPSRSRSWGVSDHHLQRGRAGGMSGWRHRHGGRQQAAARAI